MKTKNNTSIEYLSEDGIYKRSFKDTFSNFNQSTLDLINSCQNMYSDAEGIFVKDATHIDKTGLVTFEKRYIDFFDVKIQKIDNNLFYIYQNFRKLQNFKPINSDFFAFSLKQIIALIGEKHTKNLSDGLKHPFKIQRVMFYQIAGQEKSKFSSLQTLNN